MPTFLGLSVIALFFLLVCANTTARSTGKQRDRPVDMIVIHSTGGPTCDAKTGRPVWVKAGSLEANIRFIEAHPTLGIHYMIDRNGEVRKSVPEGQVSHHVLGFSQRSVAIELINDGDGVDPFPKAQIQAAVALIQDIAQRRAIGREGVVRHSDLDKRTLPCDKSMRRKVDPGAAFPFEEVLNLVFPAK